MLRLSFRTKTSSVLFVLRGEGEEGQQAKEGTFLFMQDHKVILLLPTHPWSLLWGEHRFALALEPGKPEASGGTEAPGGHRFVVGFEQPASAALQQAWRVICSGAGLGAAQRQLLV